MCSRIKENIVEEIVKKLKNEYCKTFFKNAV
jgi:hypothetical protein